MAFYLIWQYGESLLRGYENGGWVENKLSFRISFPGRVSDALPVTLRSSARDSHTFETLKAVKFYLTGSDVPVVQEQWPYLGNAFNPARAELNGGFELSFDGGRTWNRFSREVGYEKNPATWLDLPSNAVGAGAVAGQLGPFDRARLLVRYVIPPKVDLFKVLDIQLAVDFDIV